MAMNGHILCVPFFKEHGRGCRVLGRPGQCWTGPGQVLGSSSGMRSYSLCIPDYTLIDLLYTPVNPTKQTLSSTIDSLRMDMTVFVSV